MKCSQCQNADTRVIESRDVADGDAIRRRRACDVCKYRFTTYERSEHPQLIVIKNNGNRELFNRDKLLAGLYRACEKTPVTSLQLEALVASLEHDLYASGEQEIASSTVGNLVMDRLSILDEVAYVRFASVYRRFKDIASFEYELQQIRRRKATQS